MAKKHLHPYRGGLSATQVARGINLARKNAERLAEDAASLLALERYPSAAALAVLAIEEAGKVSILRGIALARTEDEIRDAWRDYRMHNSKNRFAGLPDALAQGARKLSDFKSLFTDDAEYPSLLDAVKQIALYTDCLEEAHWSDPMAVIAKDLADALVGTAKALAKGREVSDREIELWIEHLAPVWKRDASWMQQALVRWYSAMQAEGLAAPGPNEMELFIRQGVGTSLR